MDKYINRNQNSRRADIMQILKYQTNIQNPKSAQRLCLLLQQIIADFVIFFEREQSNYILVLKGNREVPNRVMQTMNKQGIEWLLLTRENHSQEFNIQL